MHRKRAIYSSNSSVFNYTVRQVIIKVFYLHVKRLATILKVFIFKLIFAQVGMFT